ncbi:hypothetical protein S7335_4091 [Synechococcus sp. PCC 7335]|nr:hypothetical protein S7335_4091 [Synechococcus sp. PCC 7335]
MPDIAYLRAVSLGCITAITDQPLVGRLARKVDREPTLR